MLKPKNIAIFLSAGVVLVLIYIFFMKGNTEEAGLVSTSSTTGTTSDAVSDADSTQAKDFLGILLSVKSIKLDNSIFSDIAFSTLRDSSITLTPDGTEGRPNPFAPIGVDRTTTPVSNTPSVPSSTNPTSPVLPGSGSAPTIN